MFDPNNRQKVSPWLPVYMWLPGSMILAFIAMWVFVPMFIKTIPEKKETWFEAKLYKTTEVTQKVDTEKLWKLNYNLCIPCYKLGLESYKKECIERALEVSQSAFTVKVKVRDYQFRKCEEGLYWNSCSRFTPTTAEHIKIFDSLVAIQNKYREN